MKILCLVIAIPYIIEFLYRQIVDSLRRKKYTHLISSDNNFFSLFVYIFSFAIVFVSAVGLVFDMKDEYFPFTLYFTAAAVHFIFIFVCPKIVYFDRKGFQCGYFKLHTILYEEAIIVNFKPCYIPIKGHADTTIVYIEANYKGYKARLENTHVDLVRTWINIARKDKLSNALNEDIEDIEDIKEDEKEICIGKVNKSVSHDLDNVESIKMNTSSRSETSSKSYKKVLLLLYIISFITYTCFVSSIVLLFFNPTNIYNSIKGNHIIVSAEVERKPLDSISVVKIDKANNIYVFYEKTNEVNIYNAEGKFQYSVITPRRGTNGGNEIAVNNKSLYIMNMEGDIFQYKNKKHIRSYIDEKKYRDKTADEIAPYSYFNNDEEPQKHNIKSKGEIKTIYNNSTEVYYLNDGVKEYIVHRSNILKIFDIGFMIEIDMLMAAIGFISNYIINRLEGKTKSEEELK